MKAAPTHDGDLPPREIVHMTVICLVAMALGLAIAVALARMLEWGGVQLL